MREQHIQISTARHHTQDENLLALQAVDNHVLSNRQAATSGAKILVVQRKRAYWEAGELITPNDTLSA